MIACAKYFGREIKTCTRGIDNCICGKEEMNENKIVEFRQHEVYEQNKLISRLKDLLMQIGYPQRGTDEENMDIFDAAKLIQSNFTLSELSH